MTLGEKFRSVEKNLATVMASFNAGVAPDAAMLSQLNTSISEGVASTATKTAKKAAAAQATFDASNLAASPLTSSGGSDEGTQDFNDNSRRGSYADGSNKRPRMDSYGAPLGVESPVSATTSLRSPHLAALPRLPEDMVSPGSNSQLSVPGSSSSTTQLALPSVTGGANSLALLAEASLAAEIDGRTQLTGLDPSFRLSTVTALLQAEAPEIATGAEKTPGLLSLGIVNAETAVELFRMFVAFS
jgi:hypothetical protein